MYYKTFRKISQLFIGNINRAINRAEGGNGALNKKISARGFFRRFPINLRGGYKPDLFLPLFKEKEFGRGTFRPVRAYQDKFLACENAETSPFATLGFDLVAEIRGFVV